MPAPTARPHVVHAPERDDAEEDQRRQQLDADHLPVVVGTVEEEADRTRRRQ